MNTWSSISSKEILNDIHKAYKKIDWKKAQKARSANILIQQILSNELHAFPLNLPGDDGKPITTLIYNGIEWKLYMPIGSTCDDKNSILKQLHEIALKKRYEK